MLQNAIVRFELVFRDVDLRRIYIVCSDTSDMAEIQVDLHGLSRKEADRLVRNIIALFPNNHFSLVLIHGYRHGESLKKYFSAEFSCERVQSSLPCSYNPGRTVLFI